MLLLYAIGTASLDAGGPKPEPPPELTITTRYSVVVSAGINRGTAATAFRFESAQAARLMTSGLVERSARMREGMTFGSFRCSSSASVT